MRGAADAAFGLSPAGQIVLWNEQAHRLLGWNKTEAVGQPCAKILGCRDGMGNPLCKETCPVLEGLRHTRGMPSTPFIVKHRSGRDLRLTRASIAVPSGAGPRALVLLQAHSATVFGTPQLDEGFAQVSAASPPTAGATRQRADQHRVAIGAADIPAVARAADQTASSLEASITEALDSLLSISSAEAAELFITMPTNPNRLVLGAHRGKGRRAFCTQSEFEWGAGLPGLAIKEGPIVCLDVTLDQRYLREQVKRKGYTMCMAVPLHGVDHPLGSLLLTWPRRSPRGTNERSFVFVLEEVASYISLLLRTGRLTLAERVRSSDNEELKLTMPPAYKGARRVLEVLRQTTAADAAILKTAVAPADSLPAQRTGALSERAANKAAALCNPNLCPIAQRGGGPFRSGRRPPGSRPAAAGARGGTPGRPPCAAALGRWPNALCLPLVTGHRLVGISLFLYRGINNVPGRHIVPLHGLYRWAARNLHEAGQAVEPDMIERLQLPALVTGAKAAEPLPARSQTTVPLAIYGLGRFRIFTNGKPLADRAFRRRRSLEILKILLTHYGTRLHRDELVELLWPDELPKAAERSVKVAIHYLRRALATNGGQQTREFILTQNGGYAFNTEAVHFFDVQAFLAACAQTQQAAVAGNGEAAVTAGTAAMELYRGDFLQEEPYADWAALRRETLRDALIKTLKYTAAAHTYLNAWDAAVHVLTRALEIDDAQEDVHRRLMELYWRMGRRDEAIRQYHLCKRALARALDLKPELETTALLQTIRSSNVGPKTYLPLDCNPFGTPIF